SSCIVMYIQYSAYTGRVKTLADAFPRLFISPVIRRPTPASQLWAAARKFSSRPVAAASKKRTDPLVCRGLVLVQHLSVARFGRVAAGSDESCSVESDRRARWFIWSFLVSGS